MQLPRHLGQGKCILDEDLELDDSFTFTEIEQALPPCYGKELPRHRTARKPAIRRSRAKKSRMRKTVSFSSTIGTIKAEVFPEIEEEQEENAAAAPEEEKLDESESVSSSTERIEDMSEPSETSEKSEEAPVTKKRASLTREKLTPAERKARREAALKEAKLAAKNVHKQRRSGRSLGRSTTIEEEKPTMTKSKGLFGSLKKRMSRSFDTTTVNLMLSSSRSDSTRSLKEKMEEMEASADLTAVTAATTATVEKQEPTRSATPPLPKTTPQEATASTEAEC